LVNKFEDVYSYIDLGKLNQLQHDEITLEDFVRDWGGGPSIIDMVAVWTRVMLGCEPADLSAAYFFLYCKSQGGLMKMRSSKMMGKYLTIKTGI
jgi:monoamine oxidase